MKLEVFFINSGQIELAIFQSSELINDLVQVVVSQLELEMVTYVQRRVNTVIKLEKLVRKSFKLKVHKRLQPAKVWSK